MTSIIVIMDLIIIISFIFIINKFTSEYNIYSEMEITVINLFSFELILIGYIAKYAPIQNHSNEFDIIVLGYMIASI